MKSENKKNHWDKVYSEKQPNEVSWTQEIPQTSLDFIRGFNVSKNAPIIDIGGGDSKLVDYLLAEGFEDITVLDISENALQKVKTRLGDKAANVKWIVSDITEFAPKHPYHIWHDRATFHFLTTPDQVKKYVETATNATTGFMAIGTFSENGPTKCSGLEIKQYNEEQLESELSTGFEKLKCINEDHLTPFNTTQNFLFCSFRKK